MAGVSAELDGILSLEELEGFAEMLFRPPSGVIVKSYTEDDQRRIAQMKIEFQKRAKK
ncbi:hypothetical protein JQX09_17875 [Sulfitobacter pseudonitzschiae]|uniref:Uncharacterized protein n=1 Tax=Pseudosulfitobacter pseudonitzschiae TaxID=1402135 RepID=A0A9Q2RWU7_9RHOB|nr:hypothetical protein [Pseudosulfitobacter pseudonitzschiae]MBM2293800.1 hypothetical protein [Pseudosulfitobacter pseudonitzschiae]MBM2298717.1 hypothetical protein [Pseudosulfitobacter pseudonitzschiae]MBM2303632.1 hypothetical protein [Pseudosulfitobacter pseudonitzschiae]MBM2313414.1 hypothetical protein [Pseudosulfitobacter pseudonitzschiae]MBM2318328.1 hypothetical protein [Pseudosulfitobacter pseudonitzschiae]